jgi:long-chain fatty acid transport protein
MRIITLSLLASASLMAGGYSIPESSINATALSAAYVANAHGADAAYYNPAAMVYNDNAGLLEVDATYIGLSSIDFSGTTGNYSSKKENFIVPTMHYASKKLGDNGARFGFSIVSPGGLSKRWDNPAAKATAEEFTLKTVEFNPSVAVPINDKVSLGLGFRVISSKGIVKSTYTASREMEGSSIDYGYNIALMVKPTPELSLAATYRSKINLSMAGNAKLYVGAPATGILAYNGDTSVVVPMPATLNLAAAYTFVSGTTIEAVYEKTFWSAYQNLDFNYPVSIGILTAAFDDPKLKNWKNTNTYRLGVTQKYNQWTAMAGIAYDETPVPVSTLGYELPDADAVIGSLGGRYQINKSWNIGLAGLIDMKKNREVHNASISGDFSNARAYLVTAGIEYRF